MWICNILQYRCDLECISLEDGLLGCSQFLSIMNMSDANIQEQFLYDMCFYFSQVNSGVNC